MKYVLEWFFTNRNFDSNQILKSMETSFPYSNYKLSQDDLNNAKLLVYFEEFGCFCLNKIDDDYVVIFYNSPSKDLLLLQDELMIDFEKVLSSLEVKYFKRKILKKMSMGEKDELFLKFKELVFLRSYIKRKQSLDERHNMLVNSLYLEVNKASEYLPLESQVLFSDASMKQVHLREMLRKKSVLYKSDFLVNVRSCLDKNKGLANIYFMRDFYFEWRRELF